MSGYGDMYKDELQARWLNKWVPLDDERLAECPKAFREQYRFTLARARDAEASLKRHRDVLAAFKGLLI